MPEDKFEQINQDQGWFTKQWLIYIGIAVVVVLLAVGGVVWYRGSQQPAQDTGQRQTFSQREVENRLTQCQDTTNPERCRRQLLEQMARDSQGLEPCLALEGAERDECVWEVVLETENIEFCKAINDQEMRTNCMDGRYFAMAREQGDRSVCENIQDDDTRARCQDLSNWSLNQETCSEWGEGYCEAVETRDRAYENIDPSMCEQIQIEEVRMRCEDGFYGRDFDEDGLSDGLELQDYETDPRNPDTDGDGLNDGLELEIGTDPLNPDTDGDGLSDGAEFREYNTEPGNPDTDGDGFSDGDEIESGYSPLKAG